MRQKITKNSAPGDNLTALERPPEVFFDLLVRDVAADLGLHGKLPTENFLVRESELVASEVRTRIMDGRTHPCKGPASAKSAAEYARYGSESVEPTRSDRVEHGAE